MKKTAGYCRQMRHYCCCCCWIGRRRTTTTRRNHNSVDDLKKTEQEEIGNNNNDDNKKTVQHHFGETNTSEDNNDNSAVNAIDTAHWMAQVLDSTLLGELILPGSHDAGMSESHNVVPAIAKSRVIQLTQTQELGMYKQLMAGSRYFDIRVNLTNDGKEELMTFHRNNNNQGMDGQALKSILDQVRLLLQEQPTETCILKFSHTGGTNGGLETKSRLEILLNDYQDVLYTSLKATGDNESHGAHNTTNLLQLPLKDVRGKAIVVMDYSEFIDPSRGRFRYRDYTASTASSNITVYDEYSNTESLSDMSKDQLAKWKSMQEQQSTSSSSPYMFLLSWTLTPQGLLSPSVRRVASKANQVLADTLQECILQQGWQPPNVVYIDYLSPELGSVIVQYNFTKSTTIK